MEEEKDKKSKHHGSAKRPHRLELSFTDNEWSDITAQASKNGEKRVTSFLRKLIKKGGVVVAPLTPEQERMLTDLYKIGINLWQLRISLKNQGMDENFLGELANFKDEFDIILKNYRKIFPPKTLKKTAKK